MTVETTNTANSGLILNLLKLMSTIYKSDTFNAEYRNQLFNLDFGLWPKYDHSVTKMSENCLENLKKLQKTSKHVNSL